MVDRSIYGIIREGAQGARVYTTQEEAAGYKIDEMPVQFLGLRFKKDEVYQDKSLELVDKMLYPFLTRNGMDVDVLAKQARLMNFMTYCDGTFTFRDIETYLEEKLKRDGLGEEDINRILSQVSLVAIGTMVETSDLKGTTFTFVDVEDVEISTQKTERYQRVLEEQQRRGIYGRNGSHENGLYFYQGNGNHDLREYFSDENLVKPALCFVISRLLQSSMNHEPISLEVLMEGLKPYTDESKSVSELMSLLDSSISYDHVSKYTKGEVGIRRELDQAYTDLAKTIQLLEFSEREKKDKTEKISKMTDGIKKYSSDMTFYQIMCSAHMWQAPIGVDPFRELSDRQIREKIEELGLVPGLDFSVRDPQEVNSDGPKLK